MPRATPASDAELVEDALGRDVRRERRVKIGRREVVAEFVVEHLRRVPHGASDALVELRLCDHAHVRCVPVRAAGGGVRHGREIGQVGANRDAEPPRRDDAGDVGDDVARAVRSHRLRRRAVALCDVDRRRHAAVDESERKLEQPRVGEVRRPPLKAVWQLSVFCGGSARSAHSRR